MGWRVDEERKSDTRKAAIGMGQTWGRDAKQTAFGSPQAAIVRFNKILLRQAQDRIISAPSNVWQLSREFGLRALREKRWNNECSCW